MAHEPHRLITALLQPTCAVRLTKVTIEEASVRLYLTATAPTAACPRCAVLSSSIHSHYQRPPDGPLLGDAHGSHSVDRSEIRVPEYHLYAPYLHRAAPRARDSILPQNPPAHHGSPGNRHGRGRAGRGPARPLPAGRGQSGHFAPPGADSPGVPSSNPAGRRCR
jgi:hypothetical protein